MSDSSSMPPFEREWRSAQRVADGLQGLGDVRAKVVGSGANGDSFGVAHPKSVARMRESKRPGSGPLELFDRPVTWLGSDVWLFDDDGHGGKLAARDAAIDALGAQLGGLPHARIHAQLFHRSDQLAETLRRHRAWPRLTHLISAAPPDGLLDEATDLVGLMGPYEALQKHFDGRPCRLSALTLPSHPLPNDAHFLDGVQRRCPELRHLGLWHTLSLDWLVHPIVEGLCSLDLHTVNDARRFDFTTLLEERERLAHLRRVLVPGHLVQDAVRARFADWPEVVFVSYDRVEVMALDIATMGFPRGHR